MKVSKLLIATIIILAGIIVYALLKPSSGSSLSSSFAQCLSQNGVKMYGAYWCPHCQNQKTLFGDQFKYIQYIECSLPDKGGQNDVCNKAEIQGYPTWEFKDGSRIQGEVTLGDLSQKTGCSLK